jgi:hypothetical protein
MFIQSRKTRVPLAADGAKPRDIEIETVLELCSYMCCSNSLAVAQGLCFSGKYSVLLRLVVTTHLLLTRFIFFGPPVTWALRESWHLLGRILIPWASQENGWIS